MLLTEQSWFENRINIDPWKKWWILWIYYFNKVWRDKSKKKGVWCDLMTFYLSRWEIGEGNLNVFQTTVPLCLVLKLFLFCFDERICCRGRLTPCLCDNMVLYLYCINYNTSSNYHLPVFSSLGMPAFSQASTYFNANKMWKEWWTCCKLLWIFFFVFSLFLPFLFSHIALSRTRCTYLVLSF